MVFGHLVLEGYCSLDPNKEDETVACRETKTRVISPSCVEKATFCKFFSYCKAANLLAATDSKGMEIDCMIIDETTKNEISTYGIESSIFKRNLAD